MGLLRALSAQPTCSASSKRRAPHGHRPARPAARTGSRDAIADAEAATARAATGSHLSIAIDYSARDAIATRRPAGSATTRRRARRSAGCSRGSGHGTGRDVDLLIRTGGEKRLSDFLLWECAYAELCFIDTMWPDFGADDLRAAIADFPAASAASAALLVAAE